jgi:acetyl esterase
MADGSGSSEEIAQANEPRSLATRLRFQLARAIFALPNPVLLALSGKRQIVIDGQALHPEMQILLRLWTLSDPLPLTQSDDPIAIRAKHQREAAAYSGPRDTSVRTRDLTIPTAATDLRARHYAPPSAEPDLPLLVLYIGGGYVFGELEGPDALCRALCRRARVHVLSVQHRHAPEHRFPCALDDSKAAFTWAVANAASLGASPDRVGVGGESSGGTLAAEVCQEAQRDGTRLPAFQLLIYPGTDLTRKMPSHQIFAKGMLISYEDGTWFFRQYVGDRTELLRDPRVSPLFEPRLFGLPPAIVVTAGFDAARDEGDAYAAALTAARVKTVHQRCPALLHGFAGLCDVSSAVRRAVNEMADHLGKIARGE